MGQSVKIFAATSEVIATNTKYDVIFIHGIGSSASSAWTNSGKTLWPSWLDHSVEDARTYLLEYPAPLLFYGSSSAFNIADRAHNIADYLASVQIGERPLVLVCHSLGGVLAKEMLRVSTENWRLGGLARNTRGVVFLATPHRGSIAANWVSLVGSQLAQDLMPDSPYLMELRSWFADFCSRRSIFVSGYAEGKMTKGLRVVSQASADPYVGDCRCVSLDADHFSIAKPESQTADIYTRILRDVKWAITEAKMNYLPATIDEIASLPALTADVHNDIVSFLMKRYRNYLPGAILLNSVSPSSMKCIVVTQNAMIARELHPLEQRWPNHFKVEKGFLGQFTSEDHTGKKPTRKGLFARRSSERAIVQKNSGKAVSYYVSGDTSSRAHSKLPSKVSVSSSETAALAQFVASKVMEESIHSARLTCFRHRDDNTEIFTSFHTIQYSFSRSVTEKLREVVNSQASNPPKIASTIERMEPRLFEHASEVISKSIAQLLEYSLTRTFHITFDVGSAAREDDTEDKEENRISVEATMKSVDYSKDIAVLSVKNSKEWKSFALRKELSHLILHSGEGARVTMKAGDVVTSSLSPGKKLKVDSVNETVFFPMPDRVTCLKSVMVLVGHDVSFGSSGAPVFDEDGVVAGMIIGRCESPDGPRVLAVDLSGIDEIEGLSELRLI